jgi:hypothetical protein
VIRDHCPAWIIRLPFNLIVPKFFVRDFKMYIRLAVDPNLRERNRVFAKARQMREEIRNLRISKYHFTLLLPRFTNRRSSRFQTRKRLILFSSKAPCTPVRIVRTFAVPCEPITRTVSPGLSFIDRIDCRGEIVN